MELEQQVEQDLPKESDSSTETDDPLRPSVAPAQPGFPDGGLRAWSVVFGAACLSFSTFGSVNSFGVFQAYYQQTFLAQYSPSTISWIGSLQYALIFMPSIMTGRLLDLGYFNLPMFICSIGFIASVFLTGQCKTYWELLLCQGIATGGFAGFIFSPTFGCVSHWFQKKRFSAFGFLAIGSAVGGTVLPIITRQLLQSVGFSWTCRILGFILLAPVAAGNLLMRRRQPPRVVKGGLFNWAAFKNPAYTLLVIATDLIWCGLLVPIIYIDISAQNAGVSPNISFYFISIANAASLVGRLSSGYLADSYGSMNILIPFTFLAAMMTYAWPFAKSIGPLVVVAIIYGVCSGAFLALVVSPANKMGGIEDVGRRMGMLLTCSAIGAGTGLPIAGAIRKASGGFEDVGAFAGTAILAGCILLMASRRLALGSWKGIF